jgi:hypothetical protein
VSLSEASVEAAEVSEAEMVETMEAEREAEMVETMEAEREAEMVETMEAAEAETRECLLACYYGT